MKRAVMGITLGLCVASVAAPLTLDRVRTLRQVNPQEAVSALQEDTTETGRWLLAEQLLRSQKPNEARQQAERFEVLFPGSLLAFRARLLSGWASLQLGEMRKGIDQLCEVIQGQDSVAAVQARQTLQMWADSGRIPAAEILRIPSRLGGGEDTLLARLQQAFAKRTGASDSGAVVVLLPQTGDFGAIGRRVARGAQLALEQAKAEIVYLDEPADPLEVQRLVRGMLRIVHPRAVVGPLLSNAGAFAASEFAATAPDVRVVFPAATSHGVAGIAPRGWQLNLTTFAQGEAAARHAWECLRAREVWIVHPRGEYGDAVAQGFETTFQRLGGRIVFRQSYPVGRNDFRAQMESVRRSALQLARDRGEDTTRLNPVLFAPCENVNEATAMISQVRALKFSPLWLGTSGWHAEGLLTQGTSTLDSVRMVTDYAPDPTRPAWKSFVSAWKARGTEPPDRLAALGFDAARLAIEGPEMSMNLWQGAQGAVRFRPGQRYNSAATVLRVKNNVFTACPCELP